MVEPAYPAARFAALRVHPRYAAHDNGFVPDVAAIEEMLGVAFWTSLRREEIYTPRLSLAFVAQFAHDQQHAIALVASQDGRFTVFGWRMENKLEVVCLL
jgi:hypothetical protein